MTGNPKKEKNIEQRHDIAKSMERDFPIKTVKRKGDLAHIRSIAQTKRLGESPYMLFTERQKQKLHEIFKPLRIDCKYIYIESSTNLQIRITKSECIEKLFPGVQQCSNS